MLDGLAMVNETQLDAEDQVLVVPDDRQQPLPACRVTSLQRPMSST
jgi:hypothetical protein